MPLPDLFRAVTQHVYRTCDASGNQHNSHCTDGKHEDQNHNRNPDQFLPFRHCLFTDLAHALRLKGNVFCDSLLYQFRDNPDICFQTLHILLIASGLLDTFINIVHMPAQRHQKFAESGSSLPGFRRGRAFLKHRKAGFRLVDHGVRIRHAYNLADLIFSE